MKAQHTDGSVAERVGHAPTYRGPMPRAEVRQARVLLCKVFSTLADFSPGHISQILGLSRTTVDRYIDAPIVVARDDSRDDDDAPERDDDAEIEAEVRNDLTAEEIRQLRSEYAPGVDHDGRAIGDEAHVRAWLTALI